MKYCRYMKFTSIDIMAIVRINTFHYLHNNRFGKCPITSASSGIKKKLSKFCQSTLFDKLH